MSDRVAEELAAMDKSLGLAPEEDTPEEEAPEEPEAPELETPEEELSDTADQDRLDEAVGGVDQTAQGQLLAGKYKTAKELERAYKELESHLGSQGKELGDLRKLMEERLPESQEEPMRIDQPMVDWFDEQIDSNPSGAALWALQNDSTGTLYERAMDAWFEMPGQARRASAFERALEAQELDRKIEQQTKPLQQQAEQQSLAQAWTQLAGEITDLSEHAEAIVAEAKESPEILRGATTAEEKSKALRKLYRLVKGDQATSLESVKEETEIQQKEANRTAKLGGTAPQTKAVSPETKSEDEQLLAAIPGFDEYLERHSLPKE
jgi:hypothetical protein